MPWCAPGVCNLMTSKNTHMIFSDYQVMVQRTASHSLLLRTHSCRMPGEVKQSFDPFSQFPSQASQLMTYLNNIMATGNLTEEMCYSSPVEQLVNSF